MIDPSTINPSTGDPSTGDPSGIEPATGDPDETNSQRPEVATTQAEPGDPAPARRSGNAPAAVEGEGALTPSQRRRYRRATDVRTRWWERVRALVVLAILVVVLGVTVAAMSGVVFTVVTTLISRIMT